MPQLNLSKPRYVFDFGWHLWKINEFTIMIDSEFFKKYINNFYPLWAAFDPDISHWDEVTE